MRVLVVQLLVGSARSPNVSTSSQIHRLYVNLLLEKSEWFIYRGGSLCQIPKFPKAICEV
jgi:hypothetical protein